MQVFNACFTITDTHYFKPEIHVKSANRDSKVNEFFFIASKFLA